MYPLLFGYSRKSVMLNEFRYFPRDTSEVCPLASISKSGIFLLIALELVMKANASGLKATNASGPVSFYKNIQIRQVDD